MDNAKLSRHEVVLAALRILDEYGLPYLTMRRIANEVGVGPSALYWHFPNKQTLLADVADLIVSKALHSHPSARWEDRLRAEAFTLRQALLAYRDSAEIVSSSLALGLGRNPARKGLVEALASGPFDQHVACQAATTTLHLILGHVSLEQQRIQYGNLGALPGEPEAMYMTSSADDFSFGIETIIAGLHRADIRAP